MPPTRLTTMGFEAAEQFQVWQEVLSKALYPVAISPVRTPSQFRAGFHADFTATGAGGAGITRGVLDPMRSRITATAANGPHDVLQLVMHQGPDRLVQARGATTRFAQQRLLVQGADEPCTPDWSR